MGRGERGGGGGGRGGYMMRVAIDTWVHRKGRGKREKLGRRNGRIGGE